MDKTKENGKIAVFLMLTYLLFFTIRQNNIENIDINKTFIDIITRVN